MSSRRSNKRKSKSLPPNALQYCPSYIAWDKEVREETKKRFREHYTGRKKVLIECIDSTINEMHNPALRLSFDDPPIYNDDDAIIIAAFKEIDHRINNWGGVQFSPQFINEYNISGKTMDKKKFIAGAKNHQDQTSWKVSGNHFFARHLSKANKYFQQYSDCITGINDAERTEVYRFICIKYIMVLLTTSIKFHRTKGKSLIRQKTLVKSDGIHIEIENLYPALKVRSFISAAKRKRKLETNKNTIIAEHFYNDLLACCQTLYRDQKQKVYNLRGAVLETESKENDKSDVYPQELMDSDTEEDKDKYEPDESTADSITSAQSASVVTGRNKDNHGASREFQRVNPRNYSVRNEINENLNRERQRNRELMIRYRNDDNNLYERNDILSENDRNESVHHQSSFNNDRRYIGSHQFHRRVSHPIEHNTEEREFDDELRENTRLWRDVFAMRQAISTMEGSYAPYDGHALPPALNTNHQYHNPVFPDTISDTTSDAIMDRILMTHPPHNINALGGLQRY